MKKYIIPLAILIVSLAVIFFVQNVYDPRKKTLNKFSATDFIEPAENFIKCYKDTDCIKVKGSACPPSSGGVEVCVNKNYFQEYISQIDKAAGNEVEVVCPQVYMVTNKTCVCASGICNLV